MELLLLEVLENKEYLSVEEAIVNLWYKELGKWYYVVWWLGKFRVNIFDVIEGLIIVLKDEFDCIEDGGYFLRWNVVCVLGKLKDKKVVFVLIECL